MRNFSLRLLLFSAMMTALVCVATAVLVIPFPVVGYFNLGDGFALLSGFFLGPWYGFAAAGIGSALADLFLGYAVYAPGTFLIKGLIGLLAGLLCHMIRRRPMLSSLLAAAVAEAEMVLGYFAYEAWILGYGSGAALSIPLNLIQGCAGIVLFGLLAVLFEKTHLREKFLR